MQADPAVAMAQVEKMMEEISLAPPPPGPSGGLAGFSAFKPPAQAAKPPAAGFDSSAGGFSL